jgi:UDP-N-acetylglucosamine--N-acetylmuramyl-(pentapeptide) pyrophosphoryl-undecaprenol N-acetylglucosamine transferase
MIAGGGTAGHIYPGVAIARALLKLSPTSQGLQVHMVGTEIGLDTKIIPKEGLPLHLIASGQLNVKGNPLRILKTLCRLPWGFVQSLLLLRKLKPKFVLGVGGYASGPLVLAAAVCGYPTAIWEPNAQPGMANRWLAPFVNKCFVVFEQAKIFFGDKSVHIGVPIRDDVANAAAKISHSHFQILHYGGSQGSRIIGRTLHEAIEQGGRWLENTKITHQTGRLDYQDFLGKYKNRRDQVDVQEFIFNMKDQYALADLVICRGGASTLAEVTANGLPSIIIPLPAADAHQERNAEELVRVGAARMIYQRDLTAEKLVAEISELKNNPEELKKMSECARRFYKPQAAEKIAQIILQEALV